MLGEQGLGDTIQFVRYAERLKNQYTCRVIVACQKHLFPLLSSVRGIDQLIDQTQEFPDFDVYAPLMSLPYILGDDPTRFSTRDAYLAADPSLTAHWKNRLSQFTEYRVGLAWQGNPEHTEDHLRSVPLRELCSLQRLSGITWFSLQHGFGVEQLHDVRGLMSIVELEGPIDQSTGAFMDTVAILQNLDLLITSDTAIAHVAAALGTPVWLLLSHVPDWRWQLTGDTSPWYPSLRLLRQPRPGDWQSVIQQVFSALAKQDPRIGIRSP